MVLRASGTRFTRRARRAPTGAERRPNPRAALRASGTRLAPTGAKRRLHPRHIKKRKKRSARWGAGRPVDVRFAPTGAERRPNPRAGPIPVPKIAQKKKRETGRRVPVARVWRRPERSVDRTRERARSPFLKLRKKKKRETGIEPATPTLARWCSTARGSNPRPPPWQGGAPPLSHSRIVV